MRALMLLFLLFPVMCAAQGLGPDAPSGASQRYEIGKRHYRKGEFAKAAAEFKVALAMHPSPKLAFNWARSAERADKIEDAIEAYRRYLQLAPDAKDRAEVESLLPVLEERLRESYPEVAMTSRPAGARIYIDGAKEPLDAVTPTTLRLKPGAHTLRLVAKGHRTLDRSLQVKAGATASVDAVLEPNPKAAPPPVEIAEPVEPRGTSAMAVTGWTALGLGIAGLGVGAFHVAETNRIADDAAGKSGEERAALEDDFEGAQTLSVVGFVAGGALLATGVVLLLLPDGEAGVALAPPHDGLVLGGRV